MTRPSLRPLLLALAGVAAFSAYSSPALAAFDGAFAPAAWTLTNSQGGNGSVFATADSLRLTSSDVTGSDASFVGSLLDYSLVVTAPTTLRFSWAYQTADDNGSSNDLFGYAINGIATTLSAPASFAAQSGHSVVTLAAGQRFSFQMYSVDSFGGSATATVGPFSVSAVPEPDSLALMLAGLGVVGFVAHRSRGQRG